MDISKRSLVLFTIFWGLIAQVIHVFADVCEINQISGTRYQKNAEGIYKFFGSCFDRPSYVSDTPDSLGKLQYLFYFGGHGSWNGWVVSSNYASYHQPLLKVMDRAEEPALVISTWRERMDTTHDDYQPNMYIKVNCTDGLSFGTVIGLSISAIVALILIICATSVYYCTYKKRNRQVNRTQRQEEEPTFIVGQSQGSDITTPPPYSTVDPLQPPQHTYRTNNTNTDVSQTIIAAYNNAPFTGLPPSYEEVLHQKEKELPNLRNQNPDGCDNV